MIRHTISLRRMKDAFSLGSLETDALNAMQTIPGVSDVLIESSNDSTIKMTYIYTLEERFWQTNEYLSKFGLERADWG